MELTFQSVFTRTHEVRPIISSLPADSVVRASLLEAWSRPSAFILHDYAELMYTGLNSSTGENNSRNIIINNIYSSELSWGLIFVTTLSILLNISGLVSSQYFRSRCADVKQAFEVAEHCIKVAQDHISNL